MFGVAAWNLTSVAALSGMEVNLLNFQESGNDDERGIYIRHSCDMRMTPAKRGGQGVYSVSDKGDGMERLVCFTWFKGGYLKIVSRMEI